MIDMKTVQPAGADIDGCGGILPEKCLKAVLYVRLNILCPQLPIESQDKATDN